MPELFLHNVPSTWCCHLHVSWLCWYSIVCQTLVFFKCNNADNFSISVSSNLWTRFLSFSGFFGVLASSLLSGHVDMRLISLSLPSSVFKTSLASGVVTHISHLNLLICETQTDLFPDSWSIKVWHKVRCFSCSSKIEKLVSSSRDHICKT